MRMKTSKASRIVVFLGVTMLSLLFCGIWWHFDLRRSLRSLSEEEASSIVKAVWAFCRDKRTAGAALPPSVTLQALADRGYLTSQLARAAGSEPIAILLNGDSSKPQDILARAEMPDGSTVITLMDGSAHLLSASQAEDLRKKVGSASGSPH